MGWCVGNVGWENKEIERAIKNFRGPNYVTPGFLYEPWARLAELLARVTPGRLVKSFRATGGTEAMEFALQAAILHTGRQKFISLEGAYHGNSIAAFTIGSSQEFKLFGQRVRKVPPPLDAEAGERVAEALSHKEIAAFICEPIGMNLDVLVPEPEFFKIVTKACKKYGTLFIADEVACGFGRTGKLFACEHFGLKPDIMCLGKAITGGYAPLGATVCTAEVAESLENGPDTWSTYGWHPRSVAAAIANLQFWNKEKLRLLNNAKEVEKYFIVRLKKMNFKYLPEIRAKGAAVAVEFAQADYAEAIAEKAKRRGLLLDSSSYSIRMFPPVNLSPTFARQALDVLEKCV